MDGTAAERAVTLLALPGLPLVEPGDDLARLIAAALAREAIVLRDDDVLVVAQKIVSKAEGRYVDLAAVTPSAEALALAADVGKDARFIEVVLAESRRIVRARRNLVIAEHRLGFVMANAGIDQSNIDQPDIGPCGGKASRVLLLPADCDASAEELRGRLQALCGRAPAVIINDSFGRPWRRGIVGVALGAAGLPALVDMRGRPDLFGRGLEVTETAFADEIAGAASLLMGQAAEGLPVVLVRGLRWTAPAAPASALLRPAEQDLFR